MDKLVTESRALSYKQYCSIAVLLLLSNNILLQYDNNNTHSTQGTKVTKPNLKKQIEGEEKGRRSRCGTATRAGAEKKRGK
ncbi:hypothetical protein RJT34_21866 [Clitoria ternatea]|uniref:Uncharacterized protein n=1 Tax=Clitoria ternatea TaxID=43366 RepID=A0AAN9P628_CLITE